MTAATSRAPAVNTYGYLWTKPADQALRQLTAAGYREFELMVQPPHLSAGQVGVTTALRDMVRAGEVRVTTLNMPSLDTNLTSAVPEMRDYTVAVFRRQIELAAFIGAPAIVVVPGRLNPLSRAPEADLLGWLDETISQIVPVARDNGVRLLIENIPFTCIPRADDIAAWLETHADPVFGVCYDVANAWFAGEDPVQGLTRLKGQIDVVHASDTTRQVWRHDPLGAGEIDFGRVVAGLDTIGWDGPFILEIIGAEPIAALNQSLSVLRASGRPFALGDGK